MQSAVDQESEQDRIALWCLMLGIMLCWRMRHRRCSALCQLDCSASDPCALCAPATFIAAPAVTSECLSDIILAVLSSASDPCQVPLLQQVMAALSASILTKRERPASARICIALSASCQCCLRPSSESAAVSSFGLCNLRKLRRPVGLESS